MLIDLLESSKAIGLCPMGKLRSKPFFLKKRIFAFLTPKLWGNRKLFLNNA